MFIDRQTEGNINFHKNIMIVIDGDGDVGEDVDEDGD